MARKDPKLCGEIRGYVEDFRKVFRDNIQTYHDYHNFVLGCQWEDDEQQLLNNYNKIPLQFNKIAPLMNHLVGEQRMNTPNLEVTPDNEDVPPEMIDIRQALVKEISLDSKAQVIYQTAFQQAAIGGFGAYRISTEYRNSGSFEQLPLPQGIKDPTRCFWDLGAETPCKTDGMHAGFYAKISRELFIKKYGKRVEGSIPPSIAATEEDSYAAFEWANDNAITITECYKRKLKKECIYLLSDNETVDQETYRSLEKMEMPNVHDPLKMDEYLVHNGMPVTVVREREVITYKIKHYKIAGDYVLDETDFPSQQLPVIFVDQNSYYDKTGKQITRPFVKDARDAQRFINYLGTQIAYLIKISRYDQFIASRANVKSPKTQLIWKNPSVIQGAIVYDESPNGNKPEQLRPPELPVSLIQQYQRACDDIQTSTGIYQTRVGDQGNEDSGAAIDARTRQGSYNTYIVFNSINRAIAVGGEIIDECIPVLFDTERKVSLNLNDKGRTTVTLNQQADEYGTTVLNDMSKGKFKVRLLPGPSYEGQKAEALQAMNQLLTADPQIFQIIADLYAKNLPIPNVNELVNRLRTIVPPEIIEAGKTGQPLPPKQPQQDPMVMVKLQELALKQQELQQKGAEMQQKAQKDNMDITVQMQELNNQRMQIAAAMQEQILRYQAETKKADTDAQISHGQNIVELLTRENHMNRVIPPVKTIRE